MNELRRRALRSGWVVCALLVALAGWTLLWDSESPAEQRSVASRESAATQRTGSSTVPSIAAREIVSSADSERVQGGADEIADPSRSQFDLEMVGRIRGRLVVATPQGNAPIEGEARIELRRIDDATQVLDSQEVTVSAGFEIITRATGAHDLLAQTLDGRFGAVIHAIDVLDGSDLDLGDIVLLGRVEIVGRVLEENSLPVGSAMVTCADRSAPSDDHGLFRIPDALASAPRIEASAPGFLSNGVSLPRRSTADEKSSGEILIRLRRSCVIAGRVLDASGNAVAGAEIWAWGTTYVTDAGGRFHIENADPEKAARSVVFARHPIAGSAEAALDPAAETVIHLESRTTARVRVSPSAAFDALARVTATRFFDLPSGESGFFVDHALQVSRDREARELRLAPVEPGHRYRVEVTTKDDSGGSVEFTIPEPANASGDFIPAIELTPPRTLRGRVEEADGRPLVGALVRAQRVEVDVTSESPAPRAITNEHGHFELRPLATAPYDLVVFPRGGAAFHARIEREDEVILRRPASASLEVVVGEFDRSMTEFVVDVRHWVTREHLRRGLGSDGIARFSELAPGSVRVVVSGDVGTLSHDGSASLSRTVDLVAGERTRVEFSSSNLPMSELVLEFVDTRGAPRADVYVELVMLRSRERRFVACDAQGVARLDRLPRDRALLRISSVVELSCEIGSGMSLAVDVDRARVEQRVVTAIGALDVRVLGANSEPRSNTTVTVEFAADGVSSYNGIRPVVTDAAGVARFERLPAGSYRVRCANDPGTLDVAVVDGEHTAIEFITAQ